MGPEGPPGIGAGSERKGCHRPRVSEALEPRAATRLPSRGRPALLLPQMVYEESAKPRLRISAHSVEHTPTALARFPVYILLNKYICS